MTSCSSNFGVSRIAILRKEAVLRKQGNQSSNLNRLSFRGVLKDATFPVFCGNKCGRHVSLQKKGTFLIMSMLQPPAESQSNITRRKFSGGGGASVMKKDNKIWESGPDSKTDRNEGNGVAFDGSGGDGSFGSGGAGGDGSGGGDDNDGSDKEEEEFGPILKYDEVMRETEASGATLPLDMLEAAKSVGIRKVLLLRYLDLQGSVWPIGFAMKSCSMLHNRMLADPSFLFKIGSEIIIDSSCATFAEVQKRGKDFWAEFELYVADLLVGLVVNVALVGMLAPYARIGQPSVSRGLLGRMQQAYASLPSRLYHAMNMALFFMWNFFMNVSYVKRYMKTVHLKKTWKSCFLCPNCYGNHS